MIINKRRLKQLMAEAENRATMKYNEQRLDKLIEDVLDLKNEVDRILRRLGLDDLERPQAPFVPEQNRVITVYGCPTWKAEDITISKTCN